MTVVPYPQQPVRQARTSLVQSLDDIFTLAETVANTDFVPRGLRGNQPAVIAAILYGLEVGLEPMQALDGIAVIDGRKSMSAVAQRALIQSHGHEIWFEETTTTRATACGRRVGSKITQRITWTLDDAKRARIAGKPNWQAYPAEMLRARASAALARMVFADVIHGMAATEEFDDVDDGNDAMPLTGGSTPPELEPKTVRRRRRSSASAPPAPVVPPAAMPEPAQPPEPAPEPEPEPEPAAEPTPAEPGRPNRAQLNMMFALFAEKGIDAREDRLAFSSRALGRELHSATELSALDASRLIDALQAEPTQQAPPADPAPQPTEAEQTVLDELEAQLGATPVPPGEFPEGF